MLIAMRFRWRLAMMGQLLLARAPRCRCTMAAALRWRHRRPLAFVGLPGFSAGQCARGRSHDVRDGWAREMQRRSEERRRRGAIIHRRKRRFGWSLEAASGDESASSDTTRYTIDDSVCPPTDPDTLQKIVQKHIRTLPKYWRSKPVANHTAEAFEEALEFAIRCGKTSGEEKIKVILDCGCGTGRSSLLLGEMHPDCIVIGIDQSLARLSRNRAYNSHEEGWQISEAKVQNAGNVLLLRAELSDFWKCCLSFDLWQQHVCIVKQYLLYPNPYPKKARLKSRFYAHPSFPLLMMSLEMDRGNTRVGATSDEKKKLLVVRSNWKGYLEEFKSAVHVWSKNGGSFEEFRPTIKDDANKLDEWVGGSHVEWEISGPKQLSCDDGSQPLTNFEAKYLDCGEPVYELSIR